MGRAALLVPELRIETRSSEASFGLPQSTLMSVYWQPTCSTPSQAD